MKKTKRQLTTEKRDENAGYNDRIAGFYDKWYRYNRVDNGAAYDKGCIKAVNSGKIKTDNFTLIQANEGLRSF